MEGAFSLVVTALLTTIANITAVVIAGRYGLLGKKEEAATALEGKRFDELGEVRKELREQVAKLTTDVDKLNREIERHSIQSDRDRVHITDLQIALRRYVSRIGEAADVITMLLEAEEHIDARHVRRARAILKLIENDDQMKELLMENPVKLEGRRETH